MPHPVKLSGHLQSRMGSLAFILLCFLPVVKMQVPSIYDMDELSTCGRTVFVGDSGVRLNGRGNVAPSQPPLNCIVYLESVYANDDGSNKLQVEVENLQIKDCNVKVILFNGRRSEGNSLQHLSCQYSSAGIFYSTSREITIKFTRPDVIVHNEYQFTLMIRPWKDRDVPGTQTGVRSLSMAAIIGIIIGCLILVGLIILFLWCYCTGRLGDFNIPGRSSNSSRGIVNGGMSNKKTNAEMMKVKDPIMFESQTDAVQYPTAPRLYQRNVPRSQMSFGRRFDSREGEYVNHQTVDNYRDDSRWSRAPNHNYEPYNVKETAQNQQNERKETLIDDVFDSDSATKDTEDLNNSGTFDDETLQKRSVGGGKWSPKAKRKSEAEVPEEGDLDSESPQLERYKSMDLQSQPDQDTIASPHHVNAGIRANIEDENLTPHGSLNRRDKKTKSPKSKRKGGKEPDRMAMPSEAFEPIFTAPITGIDYKSNQPNQAYGYPGYPPYGLIPAGMFAPGVPGTQTYAYAYQTVPPGGVPGQQGAWVVQNTPTAEGNRRTAYVMEETADPKGAKRGAHNLTPESKRKHKDRGRRRSNQEPDLSIVARGAAPPDPGQGHRSVAVKSGTDPHTGIHTTQVVWTDTAPDPSDPKPGENPQVTRKTVTRVTTKSGYGDLPPTSDPMMMLDGEEEPAFLAPSKNRIGAHSKQPAFLEAPPVPSAYTPDKENIDFYTGPAHSHSNYDHHSVPPPERTSTPQIPVHQHPSYNAAIRDRIPFDDSTV